MYPVKPEGCQPTASWPGEFCKIAASLIPKDFHIQQGEKEANPIVFVLDPGSQLAKQLHEAGTVVIDDIEDKNMK
jgi:hypothetical protein